MLKDFFYKLDKKTAYISIGIILVSAIALIYFLNTGRSFEITRSNQKEVLVYEEHPLTGQRCRNYNKRPFAVMLATDSVTRPLSSIGMADIVVEMPVVKDSINRLMAVYICSEPEEIGSVRSSRHDFIPLAAGFDAIYAHWGGSNFAANELDRGVIDNINALINPNNVFYRKNGVPMPHDGFTSYERLRETANYLGYRLDNSFEGYEYVNGESREASGPSTLVIGYPVPYNVSYIYNKYTNTYMRWRGGTPELDKLTGDQVETSVIAIIKTTSRQLNVDYNDVDVTGSGSALVFQDGRVIPARWEKGGAADAKLRFLDETEEEIKFVRGRMWIQYIDVGTSIKWGDDNF